MSQLQVRTVKLELLRPGPPHNQLLSPLTQYLAICGDSGAGVVQLPYEQATFERRLTELRYDGGSDERLHILRQTGVDVARILAAVPGVSGALTADSDGHQAMIHLRITLSASELALLPFELSKVPTTADGQSEAWLALQTKPPVCITRHVRTVSSEGVEWPTDTRILFIAGPTGDIPFDAHRQVLERAIEPFRFPVHNDPVRGSDARITHYGDLLTIIESASLDDVVSVCRNTSYTHVHVLAHGALDTSSKGNPFGIRLAGRRGGSDIVSGERFASALSRVDGHRIHRPSVVSMASCDTGLIASLVEPASGASFAHTLHQSGIPLVVASQFPLTKDGSVTVASILYEGLLAAENPWIILHQLRAELHSRYGADSHDWASLVVYEALPPNIVQQFETVRYTLGKRRLDAALARVDGAVQDGTLTDGGPIVAAVRAAVAALPDQGPYAMECHGLHASAMKRLAHAAFLQAERHARREREDAAHGEQEEPAAFLRRSCESLEDALLSYQQAGLLFLRNDAGALQRVATLHWVLVQELSLRAVLREGIDHGQWGAACLAATAYLDHADRQERAWAHGSLAELWLLRLTMPASDLTPAQIRERAIEHVNAMVRLYPGEDAFPLRSTRSQLRRYLDWWASEPFEAAATSRPHRATAPWPNTAALIDAVNASVRVLSARERESSAPRPQPAPADGAVVTPGPAQPLLSKPGPSPSRPSRKPSERAFLEIHMLPAEHGDCLWVEYGTDPRSPSRLLIDCGTARTTSRLMAKIERLPPSDRKVDLFVMTHIDDDHIGGAIPFLAAEMGGLEIGDLWFNGYKHLSNVLGAAQGERFTSLIERQSLPWNRFTDGGPISVGESLTRHELPGGMVLTLLSPTAGKLDALRERWEKEAKEKGFVPGEGIDPDDFLGGAEAETTDVDALAALPFKSDKAAPNGSSIAFLAEFEGRSALFAGDAHPPVLEQSIARLLEQRNLERLPLSAFKVSHHASHSNTSPELLNMIDCERYLISTNGARFQHPHREAIGRIIKLGGRGRRPQLFFNYRSKINEVWARPDLQERYGYTTVYPSGAEGGFITL